MVKQAVVWLVVAVGLVTFFLPLARLQAPLVGTQEISAWDTVKPRPQTRKRADLGLSATLERLATDFYRKKRREAPLSVRQAEALKVSIPLAYLSLVLAGALAALRKTRILQGTAAVGLLAGVYSLLSVFWLGRGVKEMVAGGGSRRDLLGMVRRSVAERVDVSPELGLYLLVAALAALLLVSFLPTPKR